MSILMSLESRTEVSAVSCVLHNEIMVHCNLRISPGTM